MMGLRLKGRHRLIGTFGALAVHTMSFFGIARVTQC